jgi:hypothetical protein
MNQMPPAFAFLMMLAMSVVVLTAVFGLGSLLSTLTSKLLMKETLAEQRQRCLRKKAL